MSCNRCNAILRSVLVASQDVLQPHDIALPVKKSCNCCISISGSVLVANPDELKPPQSKSYSNALAYVTRRLIG